MKISFDSIKPVYLQIAEGIEDDIIFGKLKEGDGCYSQLVIAKELNVNPATAAKGINMLVQKGILEKQRGLSMVVAKGSKDILIKERKESGLIELIKQLTNEADMLKLSEQELIDLIKSNYRGRGKENE